MRLQQKREELRPESAKVEVEERVLAEAEVGYPELDTKDGLPALTHSTKTGICEPKGDPSGTTQ